MGWMSAAVRRREIAEKREGKKKCYRTIWMCAVPCHAERRHAMKKNACILTDCMYVCMYVCMFQKPSPPPSHHTRASLLTHSITPHYEARSVIHARTGSAPPQKKGGSQRLDATAPDPEHQHQRSHHLRSQLQRQHHQYRDQHRPTSDRRAAAGREDDEVARQVQVQTREVEAVVVAVVAAAAGIEAAVETVEIAVVRVVVVVLEVAVAVAVEQLQVPMEMHR